MNRRLAIGTLVVVLLGLTAACGSTSSDSGNEADETDLTLQTKGDPGTTESRAGAPQASQDGAGSAGSLPALESATRKVIHSSELTLEAGDVGARYLEIGQIAVTSGGFVADAQFLQRNRDGVDDSRASITIRVPASSRDAVLARLRTLDGVTVTSERAAAREVTEEYTDLGSRLRNLERSEQQYLTLLQRATSIQDILTISERVDGVRAQIEQIEGRLQVLDDLAEMATIAITLEPGAVAAKPGNGPGGFTAAWINAWQAVADRVGELSVAGAWALVIALCAAPFVVVSGGIAMVVRHRRPATPIAS